MELSATEARRIALHAQGYGRARPAKPTMRHVRDVVTRLGAVQIDAVNVLVRAQYLTLYSRLGPYPTTLLDDLTHKRHGAFEYWGHAASILPMELHPAMRWKMASSGAGERWQAFRDRVEKERPGYLDAVLHDVATRGPIAFTGLSDPGRREKRESQYAESSLLWYRWADGKTALEGLFDAGVLAAAGRKGGFERLYDLAEHVVPAGIRALPTPEPEEGQRILVRHAARALGVATAKEIAYYFFLPVATTKARLRELTDAGDVVPVRVQGWPQEGFLAPGTKSGRVTARALLSPFDSLLFERARVERVFGFRHSFELYLPPAKRAYGYYVLPFLLGDALMARVDVKADRASGRLLVLATHLEPGAGGEVRDELAGELGELATWLGLEPPPRDRGLPHTS